MKHTRTLLCCTVAIFAGAAFAQPNAALGGPARISTLKPADVLEKLDLDLPGLEKVKAAFKSGNRAAAWNDLVLYYRNRTSVIFEEEPPIRATPAVIQAADAAVKHVFSIGLGYPPQSYGPVVDWSSDPVHDIEWVAGMERFYWQRPLIAGYRATHDEKYVKAWMNLTGDWIAKHLVVDPLAFDWLDIQVGIRATNMCAAFDVVRHSPSITPEFLAVFLASIHDHATKTALYPRLTPHNKAILEDMGLLRDAVLFPEFSESRQWLHRAYEVFDIVLPAQVNPEGVQMEWTPSYHTVVAGEMARVLDLCVRNHLNPPSSLLNLTRKAFDYWLAMTAPDHRLPMFGDTTRDVHHSPDYSAAGIASQLFHEPVFDLLAGPDFKTAPPFRNRAFPQSGMFFFRSGWEPEDIYLALHNSPPALSQHDQPDNGSFELYGFGRWLMPDTGSYAYEHTPHDNERDWFRQTKSHQTLTLDGKNSINASSTRLWKDLGGSSVVTFDNASYPGLVHRRTVFFVDNRHFVFLDEAVGEAKGLLDLHFQFAPGPFSMAANHSAHSAFKDGGNVAIWEAPQAQVDLLRENGQTSSIFNSKQSRPAVAYRARSGAPFVYLTVVAPFKGMQAPKIQAQITNQFKAGDPRVEIDLSTASGHWRLKRDLDSSDASIVDQQSVPHPTGSLLDDSKDERQKRYDQSLIDIKDQPGLPRVLLIGDSISIYYTMAARERLKGKANLHHIPVNGGDTDFGVKNLSSWLGSSKWNVICFNSGLHDLVVKPNGEHEVPLSRYQSNLDEMVSVLSRTGAKLIWTSTTPVPEYIKDGPTRRNADVIAYNSAAFAIMQRNNIHVDDLYGLALPRLKELQLPANVHFTNAGSEVLGGHVAQEILRALAGKK